MTEQAISVAINVNNFDVVHPSTRVLSVKIVDARPGDISSFFMKLPNLSTLVVRLDCKYEATAELLTVAYYYLRELRLLHIDSCFISPMAVRCIRNFIEHRPNVAFDICNSRCICIEEMNKVKGSTISGSGVVAWFYYSECRHNKGR